MPTRLVTLFLILLAAPAFGQKPPASSQQMQQQISQRVDQHQQAISRVDESPAPDAAALARQQAISREAQELWTLSAAMQADLEQLRKGFLAKDLHEDLKKMEKLSKKLRRDVEP
jgi:hypothetical protein